MGYIGNSYSTQASQLATDFFSGNGVTTTFTLTRPVQSNYAIEVVVNNVQQNPATAYSINASNQLVLTGAPSTGTNNIYVMYNALVAQVGTVGQGVVGNQQLSFITNIASGANSFNIQTASPSTTALTIDQSQNLTLTANITTMTGTGALGVPIGTTAQRPAVPSVGMHRWNTTLGAFEIYTGSLGGWVSSVSAPYLVEYLVVAGGAGGGNSGANYCGGGGAGGLLQGTTLQVTPLVQYTITVGGGGGGETNGNNSSIAGTGVSITAIGGGAGRGNAYAAQGYSGGSGGGGTAVNGLGGTGTAGQGNNGGIASSANQGGQDSGAGAGGGAGGQGGFGQSAPGPFTNSPSGGGAGLQLSISGNATWYAAGGGGSGYYYNGTKQNGIGGATPGTNGVSGPFASADMTGATNTGAGGGGGRSSSGGSGGSGIVIIRYLSSFQRATGGNSVTTSGGYYIHTFTGSGTFTA